MTVTNHVTNQTRTKVSSEVDRVSSFPAEASADAKDDEEEAERRKVACTDISIILQGVDQEHQKGASDKLGEELTGFCHELCWIGAENTSCSSRAADSANIGTTLKNVDRRLVVGVNNRRRSHGTENLGDHIGGELSPGELAEDAVGERDSRIKVGA